MDDKEFLEKLAMIDKVLTAAHIQLEHQDKLIHKMAETIQGNNEIIENQRRAIFAMQHAWRNDKARNYGVIH